MIKVFFHSNVIIDYISGRDAEQNSLKLVDLVVRKEIKGYLEARQLTDIFYSIRKYNKDETIKRDFINFLIDNFEIIPSLGSVIKYCISTKMSDFEDAILYETFKINCLDYFVTSNVSDYANCDKAITPKELRALLDIMLQNR